VANGFRKARGNRTLHLQIHLRCSFCGRLVALALTVEGMSVLARVKTFQPFNSVRSTKQSSNLYPRRFRVRACSVKPPARKWRMPKEEETSTSHRKKKPVWAATFLLEHRGADSLDCRATRWGVLPVLKKILGRILPEGQPRFLGGSQLEAEPDFVRKPYHPPCMRKITSEQAAIVLVGRAWEGDEQARALLSLLFSAPRGRKSSQFASAHAPVGMAKAIH
jgi:hypothetical protein